MASMRNGQGDEWFLLFGEAGAALKGFAHESPVPSADFAKEVQNSVPGEFGSFLQEPAFSMESATFCYWRRAQDNLWSLVSLKTAEHSNADDGSTDLLSLLVASSSAYEDFSNDYFERKISREVINAIYEHAPLTAMIVAYLNPEIEMKVVAEMAKEIGYPCEDSPETGG
jgi:hypothetical protein